MWPFKKEVKEQQFETVLQRLVAAASGMSADVNPETCIQAPTVQSIVTAISRRISITPVHVYQTTYEDGKETKERLPNHPVIKLLRQPNDWQSSVDYWQDLASSLVRYGRYIAIKGQGRTGPIRKLFPVKAGDVSIERDPTNQSVTFKVGNKPYEPKQVHYIRGPARDYLTGDSPVDNIKTAIGLEIACEEYGATFFENGAMPLLVFKYMQGMKFKTPEDEQKFIDNFQEKFSGTQRHKALLMPYGIEPDTSGTNVENDKAQFLETRKFNQTVIAGAWNVPPHLVGNLENAHYNNVEQQDKDFTLNVIMPYIRAIESAMERDLLTQEDRNKGIVIRFNMDATLRADFKTRMEGYEVQIRSGMIRPADANEREGRNPTDNDIPNSYYYSANLMKEGEERGNPDTSTDESE